MEVYFSYLSKLVRFNCTPSISANLVLVTQQISYFCIFEIIFESKV